MSDDEEIDQQIRINELREAARGAAGGEMTEWESDDAPPELVEQFWGNVLAYESAGETCHINHLEEQGIALPCPDELDDAELSVKLWEVFHGLAKLNVFFSQTDHLSDRELYEYLWNDALREVTADFPPDSGWRCHFDVLGGCSDEDNDVYLKYYADEDFRERWQKDFPDDTIPLHVDPPYDRDRNLPQAPLR